MASVLGNGVRWVRTRGHLRLGESVAIVGAGAQGLATLLAARAAGAGQVIVLGRSQDRARLSLARELGADCTVDVDAQDPVQTVRDLTGGRGADLVIEAAGAPQAVTLAMQLVRRKGRVVLVGVNGGRPASLVTDLIVNNELTVLGGHGQAWDVEPAVQMINSGRWPVHRLVSHRFPLQQAEDAMRLFISRADPTVVRVALTPSSAGG